MFREVSVVESREVLRLWLRGQGVRETARLAGVDRKTVRRYVAAGEAAGLVANGSEAQLTEAAVGAVLLALRSGRPPGRGRGWEQLERERSFLRESLEQNLTLTKIHILLRRRGLTVPYRTLHRFCVAELGFGRDRTTVRVADCEPGQEVQVDYGRMGLVFDLLRQRRRVAWCLIFTSVFSRHMFCWLSFQQTVAAVIEGFEHAWAYFDGIFRVVIPDNLTPVVIKADPLTPRFNPTFLDYAQARGFAIDPARVRRPTDKPRVENAVRYVRCAGFKGENFVSLEQAREWMISWARDEAGNRIHGTTRRRPKEHFELEERHLLLPAPESGYDVPMYADAKVGRDHHISVAKALYSVPGEHIGKTVQVRADRSLVKIFWRGQLIKTHPRKQPGGRSTDPADYPQHKRVYAMRDVDYLRRVALSHGVGVGSYAARLLESPLPWTRMRHVYKLLGLVHRYGPERVNDACGRALDLDVVDVYRISRMLERALESAADHGGVGVEERVVQLRFARAESEFGLTSGGQP